MFRKLFSAFAALMVTLVFLNGVAGAQVAAPSLLPGSVRVMDPSVWIAAIPNYGENFTTLTDGTFTPDNPAAMQWAEASEIAVGQFDTETTHDDILAIGDSSFDFSGSFYGGRWVNPYFAIGFENIEWSGTGAVNGDMDNTHNSVALSVNLFDTLSIGMAMTSKEQDLDFSFVAIDLTFDWDIETSGMSLRLGDIFYVGFVSGTEALKLVNITTGSLVELERDIQQVAIALSTQGETKWHLEYQQGSKDPATDGAEYFAEEEEEVFIAEVRSGQFVAGLTLRNATSVRPVTTTSFSSTFSGEIESTRYAIGWISSFGLALSAAMESTEITSNDGPFTRTVDATVLSASYQF